MGSNSLVGNCSTQLTAAPAPAPEPPALTDANELDQPLSFSGVIPRPPEGEVGITATFFRQRVELRPTTVRPGGQSVCENGRQDGFGRRDNCRLFCGCRFHVQRDYPPRTRLITDRLAVGFILYLLPPFSLFRLLPSAGLVEFEPHARLLHSFFRRHKRESFFQMLPERATQEDYRCDLKIVPSMNCVP